MAAKVKQWRETLNGKEYLVSTDPCLVDRDLVNRFFASDDLYWAKALSQEQLELMIAQSLNFSLHEVLPSAPPAKTADSPSSPRTPSPTIGGYDDNDVDVDDDDDNPSPGQGLTKTNLQQIGYARLITDYTTTAYLTDVFVVPECRKQGFGTLLMRHCREVLEAMPVLRRAWLVAGEGAGENFYMKELGFVDFAKDEDSRGHLAMTRRFNQMKLRPSNV